MATEAVEKNPHLLEILKQIVSEIEAGDAAIKSFAMDSEITDFKKESFNFSRTLKIEIIGRKFANAGTETENTA